MVCGGVPTSRVPSPIPPRFSLGSVPFSFSPASPTITRARVRSTRQKDLSSPTRPRLEMDNADNDDDGDDGNGDGADRRDDGANDDGNTDDANREARRFGQRRWGEDTGIVGHPHLFAASASTNYTV